MNEPLSTEPYKGVRDFYPSEWARLDALFATMRGVLRARAYEEYAASPLERAELYESKTSEEIVNEQTYTFLDRGERRVTLRPEMTPTLARMVAAKRRELTFPLRWFSIPTVFRYERPQRGRLREHYQLNVDLLGIKDAKADGEIVVLAHALLTAFGAKNTDFVIRINSRAVLTAACQKAGLNPDTTRSYLRLLDKKSKMSKEEFDTARASITATDPLTLIESAEIEAFVEALKVRGIENAVFDPTLTRGFDYYTGMVFEVFDTNPANPRSLFGGGRYDGLVALFGGEPIAAVGFGMGDVTLTDFLETHGLLPEVSAAADIYLGTPSEADIAGAQEIADELRAAGLSVLVNVTDRSLGDQIREADKRGIKFFAAVGTDERASKTFRVKRLSDGEEQVLAPADISHFVRA